MMGFIENILHSTNKIKDNLIGHDSIISVIIRKLNVSGHMLIWTFFSCNGMRNSCLEFVHTFQLHPV
jgi:hypothetical protein